MCYKGDVLGVRLNVGACENCGHSKKTHPIRQKSKKV